MAHGISGIDHVLIAVADLEAARRDYTRLGFTLTPRGRHVGWGTANYCAMFPRNYIELLGVVDPGADSAGLADDLAARGEGAARVALATNDASRAGESLAAAGFEPGPLRELGRALELPEGPVELRFRLVMLPARATAGLPMFLCEHRTPGHLRQPPWLNHPNGAALLAAATVVVDDPLAAMPLYERLFGPGATTSTDDTVAAHAGACALIFATTIDLEMLHPEVDFGAPKKLPHIAALRFAVADPPRTARYLADAGVRFTRGREGALRVAPALAHGVLLEFARFPADDTGGA